MMLKKLLYLLVTVLFFISCQKEVEIDLGNGGSGGSGGGTGGGGTGGGGTGGGSTYPYYFIGTVGGSPIKYEADDLSSTYGCGTSQPENSLGFTDYDIYEGTVLMNPIDPSKSTIRVHILKYFDHEPTGAERVAMIKTGTYPFGVGNVNNTTVNGATIDYIDANGNNWFSETGSQSGSTFTITELITNTSVGSAKIFKATFSCRLYDVNGSNSIVVSNATIRGKILSP